MTIDTKHLISITDANRNFSRVGPHGGSKRPGRRAEEQRAPYLIVEFSPG